MFSVPKFYKSVFLVYPNKVARSVLGTRTGTGGGVPGKWAGQTPRIFM